MKKRIKSFKGLKILFSAEDFWPRLGGGEAFIDEFLTEITKENEVSCVYIGEKKQDSKLNLIPVAKSYAMKNVPLFNRTLIRHYFANKRWKKVLRRNIKKLSPDLIITQLIYAPASIDVAKEFGIPVVLFIHNYEHFSPNLFRGVDPLSVKPGDYSYIPFVYKLQWPFYKILINWHARALKKANLILPDTAFIEKVVKRFYGLKSYHYYPVVDLEKYIIPKKYSHLKKEYVTFINPIKNKGVEILIETAKRMPETNFLVVCGADAGRVEGLKILKNITFLSECPDVKEAYAKTKLLMVPSLWPEPFGRVVMEAGINSIPSIVSPLGGLPEAVGDGGYVVNNLFDVDEWKNKIEKALDPKNYKNLSKKAYLHAKANTLQKQMDKFKKLVQQALLR